MVCSSRLPCSPLEASSNEYSLGSIRSIWKRVSDRSCLPHHQGPRNLSALQAQLPWYLRLYLLLALKYYSCTLFIWHLIVTGSGVRSFNFGRVVAKEKLIFLLIFFLRELFVVL